MNHITIFLESLPVTALVASCHLRKRLGRSFLRLTDSQDLLEERLRNPSSSLEERIESAKRLGISDSTEGFFIEYLTP